jgi:hypothetical protein
MDYCAFIHLDFSNFDDKDRFHAEGAFFSHQKRNHSGFRPDPAWRNTNRDIFFFFVNLFSFGSGDP